MSGASAQLADGIAALGVTLAPAARGRLEQYVALLQKWNKTYNLTAVRDRTRIVTHHLLDSLAVLPHIESGPLLDVGSGAGLPGIPLALARPQMAVTLLDANHKKAAFLRQAKAELELDNVEVVCERAEAWGPLQLFATVISRALCELSEFVGLAGRYVAPGGTLAAMKGLYPDEEVSRLPAGWRLRAARALSVPGIEAPRHLILLERA